MTLDDIAYMLGSLNIYIIYGTAAALTVVPILYRTGLLRVPRPLALVCWYAVILMAVSWLAFHAAYFATHDPRDSGLGTLARTLAFVPVYACALIVAFAYPRKRPQHDIPT